jgi:DNA-binding transcriptional ArsR family regulator
MSSPASRKTAARASVFAALGDVTRLALLARLSAGEGQSITALSGGTRMTRQAVAKHLRVLEEAGVVARRREGREMRFALAPAPLTDARAFLADISAQWDDALSRLKHFVEK